MTLAALIAAEQQSLAIVRAAIAEIGDQRRVTTEARHRYLTLRDIERRINRTIRELEELATWQTARPSLQSLWSSSKS